MVAVRKLISVIDDDISVRESLPGLLQSFGFDVESFASAEEFLDSPQLNNSDCLILDVKMDGMSGPALHLELKRREIKVPVVFITANPDGNLRTRLLAQGAVDCLFKPCPPDTLELTIARALAGNSLSYDPT